MRRVIGVAVVLVVIGWTVAGVPLAGPDQLHGAPMMGGRQATYLPSLVVVSPGHEAGYPCPPVGTEGPPMRHLPESRVGAGSAVGAVVR